MTHEHAQNRLKVKDEGGTSGRLQPQLHPNCKLPSARSGMGSGQRSLAYKPHKPRANTSTIVAHEDARGLENRRRDVRDGFVAGVNGDVNGDAGRRESVTQSAHAHAEPWPSLSAPRGQLRREDSSLVSVRANLAGHLVRARSLRRVACAPAI